ncbi:MAG: 16S rRNA (cytosine(1402)-N(4))-methyltransferase RsmH [Clostridia bacterium]|nr:16S rRNA (cytosine(1402)-N(4))-methyltransferase RsmH [Clostridia bacterium]
MDFKHVSVMLDECIDGLNIKPDGTYVDGTMGGAGHSIEIVKRLSSNGKLIGIDRDKEAIAASKERLKDFNNVIYIHNNHDNIKEILCEIGIDSVDGILLDLGVSSYQLDNPERGFSYMSDSSLDMRMDKTQEKTAKEIVNFYSEKKLADIIFEYGEEKYSRRIAKNICLYRKNKMIETTGELVNIIKESVPFSNDGHPAKRTFQAIRIEVNDEIETLYNSVMNSIDSLKSGGRLCVLTFHSLEDRTVKKAFKAAEGICTCPPGLPYCVCGAIKKGKVITKKPLLPTEEEMRINSRSKSAKLRIFEKV